METKTLEIIPFNSRDGDKYSLTLVGDNIYKANIGNYYTIHCWSPFEGKEGYRAVDPSGGPLMTVGYVFSPNNRVIKSITSGKNKEILIEFEK